MTGTRKSGKAGGTKGPRKRSATGTRSARPAASDRGKAVNERQESAEKYKFLIDATNTGYVILDDRGRVLEANQEYVRMTGRGKLEDIFGRPVTDWTAPYDLERNAAEVPKCLRIPGALASFSAGAAEDEAAGLTFTNSGVTPTQNNCLVVLVTGFQDHSTTTGRPRSAGRGCREAVPG